MLFVFDSLKINYSRVINLGIGQHKLEDEHEDDECAACSKLEQYIAYIVQRDLFKHSAVRKRLHSAKHKVTLNFHSLNHTF